MRYVRALLLCAGVTQIAWGGYTNIRESLRSLRNLQAHRHETATSSRRRVLGEAYAKALERIETRVPRNGTYVLLDLDPKATAIVLQGDLAPRRAILVTSTKGLRRRLEARRAEAAPRMVVVHRGFNLPAEIYPVAEVLRKWRP